MLSRMGRHYSAANAYHLLLLISVEVIKQYVDGAVQHSLATSEDEKVVYCYDMLWLVVLHYSQH